MIWLLSAPAFADDPAELVKRIEARYSATRTLNAAFTQTVKSGIYGEDVQTGTLLLERPNHMRWQFDGVGARLFVADGQWLWMYSPGDKQVVKSPQIEGTGGTDVLLEALAHLSERFVPTFVPPPPGGVWHLVLIPRDKNHPFVRYEVDLTDTLDLRQLILVDGQSTVTRLDFRDVVLGDPAPDGAFAFQVPPGVEILNFGGAL